MELDETKTLVFEITTEKFWLIVELEAKGVLDNETEVEEPGVLDLVLETKVEGLLLRVFVVELRMIDDVDVGRGDNVDIEVVVSTTIGPVNWLPRARYV